MKKLLTFEEIRRYLIDDAYVRDEIVWTYKDDAPTILKSLAKGEEPQLPDADLDMFLIDLLHNVGRLYKRYTAHGSYGSYHIDTELVCPDCGAYMAALSHLVDITGLNVGN